MESSHLASGNHFNPFSRLFVNNSERKGAAISTTCVVFFLSILCYNFSFKVLLDAYVVPYFFFVIWLSLVTYLHHTDPTVNYYRNKEWTFFKGALSTIDRSYFSIIDHLHHDIGTHVVHHLFFTKIPHYHLVRATEAVKPLLGNYYLFDPRPFWTAFVNNRVSCKFVPDNKSVVKYCSDEQLPEQYRKQL